jgi:hypothetical protein
MDSTEDKTGKSYEVLTQAIFQLIHDQEEVPNLRVEHDIKLQGKSATHQIDVYWQFEQIGLPYETIVQVKDWSRPVDQGDLFKFNCVICDLPGSPKGIFVTRTGYQSGAREYAKAHGIVLYELREVAPHSSVRITPLGWANYKVIPMALRGSKKNEDPVQARILGSLWTVFEPQFSDLKFQPDGLWLEKAPLTRNADHSAITFPPLPFHEIILYDENHNAVANLDLVLRQVLEVMKAERVDKKHVVHAFEHPTFLGPIATGLVYYVKVASVSVNVEIQSKQLPIRWDMSTFAHFVLHNITSGKDTLVVKPKV